jgi:hypothetical protein
MVGKEDNHLDFTGRLFWGKTGEKGMGKCSCAQVPKVWIGYVPSGIKS